ncbi:hypothetical protein [uncultured Roseobacter sp.]|uniref:hypothetical protein n=1 Tax=uncultured Roseobacter sp. TaxID=114847 RepID=UPI0026110EBB|nr:hypothetical protein [uncultured Roseobacter sp.]
MATPLVFAATAALAVDAPPAMTAFVEAEIMSWAQGPEVIAAVNEQNARTTSATSDQITAWDTAWRAEVGQTDQPMISEVIEHPLSAALRDQVAASGGRITELFVMDAQGLNVAASDITSDYWQGDEAKHSETYGAGPGAVFVDEIELDESTQTYQGQVSFTLTDPATGEAVGAVTVGLNAESFY